MATIKELADNSAATKPTKKVSKSKLAFKASATPSKVILVENPVEDILTIDKPSAKKEDAPFKKEPNLPNLTSDAIYIADVTAGTDRVILPVEEAMPKPVSVDTNKQVAKPAPVQQAPKPVNNHSNHQRNNTVKHNSYSTNAGYKQSTKELPPIAGQYPKHKIEIAAIVKNNSEIRRFTSLGILNYLEQKGLIVKSKSRYVNFQWDRFVVKVDNLRKEYSYAEPFFLNALAASFPSFSALTQRTMDEFIRIELNKGLDEVISNEEINEFYDANEKHIK